VVGQTGEIEMSSKIQTEPDFSSLADASIFALEREDIDRLLVEQTECTLSWTNKAGHPVSVICGFVLRGNDIWMASTDDRVRTKALRRDPRAALTVSSSGTRLGNATACNA